MKLLLLTLFSTTFYSNAFAGECHYAGVEGSSSEIVDTVDECRQFCAEAADDNMERSHGEVCSFDAVIIDFEGARRRSASALLSEPKPS